MVRHKVYVTIEEYNSKGYVGETRMNAHHQKVEEVDILINADTEKECDLGMKMNVKPLENIVYAYIGDGKGYELDLRRFKGKIIISPEQLIEISSAMVSEGFEK